jgi:predicted amidophosphoribosyltransferase
MSSPYISYLHTMGALEKITDLADHCALSPDDNCYFLLEYHEGSALINNLKKKMDRRQKREWPYKEWTIQQIAAQLAAELPGIINFTTTTFLPIPPSKTRNNPLYDDRLLQILRLACPTDADIREPIICREDHAAAHESEHERPTIDELIDNYTWVGTAQPLRPNIVLFDDVITNGTHFTACKRFLLQHHPAARTTGIFISRHALKKSLR